jgi:hypothetical protein
VGEEGRGRGEIGVCALMGWYSVDAMLEGVGCWSAEGVDLWMRGFFSGIEGVSTHIE